MVGDFPMSHDLFRFSNPQECTVCKRIFLTPRELVSHNETFHSRNTGFTTYGSPVAPMTTYGSPVAPTATYGSAAAPTATYGSPAAPMATYGSPVAPNYRMYPNQNRISNPNPNPGFPNPNPGSVARNQFDMNYYRKGYLDEQGRFHRGAPPVSRSNSMCVQNKKPRLMEFFPGVESDGGRTMPLLSQLEQQKVKDSVGEIMVEDVPAHIDLTLRL